MSVPANELVPCTIEILKATTKHYKAVKDDRDLPGSFHEAGEGLPLIQKALETARPELCKNGQDDGQVGFLRECYKKAKLSERVFKDVVEAPKPSRLERYNSAVQQKGEGNKLAIWTSRMMLDVCNLAENDAIKRLLGEQIQGLRDARENLEKMDSVPREDSHHNFSAHDNATQINNNGGNQNNNTGKGNQFTGSTFHGPLTFNSS